MNGTTSNKCCEFSRQHFHTVGQPGYISSSQLHTSHAKLTNSSCAVSEQITSLYSGTVN